MTPWVDPRDHPTPSTRVPPREANATEVEVDQAIALIRSGRFYELEDWIRQGRSVQCQSGTSRKTARDTVLSVALEGRLHSLVHLVLANGYQTHLEKPSPFDLVLRLKAWDLMDLLFTWQVDPRHANPDAVLSCRDVDVMWRFWQGGCDMLAGHALARMISKGTPSAGMLVLIRRLRDAGTDLQDELDIALNLAAERGTASAVRWCLDQGADPRRPNPDAAGRVAGVRDARSAIERAVMAGHAAIVVLLKPDPSRDDVQALSQLTRDSKTFLALSSVEPRLDAAHLLMPHFVSLAQGSSEFSNIWAIEEVFRSGATWRISNPMFIDEFRRTFLAIEPYYARKMLKWMDERSWIAPEVWKTWMCDRVIVHRLSEFRLWRLVERLYAPGPVDKRLLAFRREFMDSRPSHYASSWTFPSGKNIGREEIHAMVWKQPMTVVSKSLMLSDNGLRKACRRMHVPFPPRGHWAKIAAGHRVKPKPLPELPSEVTPPISQRKSSTPAAVRPAAAPEPGAPAVQTNLSGSAGRFGQYNFWQRRHIFNRMRGSS